MVIKNSLHSSISDVQWIGGNLQNVHVSRLEHLNVLYYKKCIIGPLTIAIGDYILVPNADARDPDTIDGCDIAKILNLYELIDTDVARPYRAIVQWYSRPRAIPHKEFDSDDICIDFNLEVIEEHRPYDTTITLDSVYAKCSVIIGSEEDNAENLLKPFEKKKNKSCPMFVCRYKFIKEQQFYRLVPLHSIQDYSAPNRETRTRQRNNSAVENAEVKTVSSARKPKAESNFIQQKKRRASVATASAVEFIDMTCHNNENIVSPIKIIGGRSVVRLSEKKKDKQKEEINANYLTASPLTEKNHTTLTPTSRAAAARRNLNLTLENHADTTADSDCLNYSIVKSTPNSDKPDNDMKIKLRLSERRRSVRLASVEEDPLAISETKENHLRKRLAVDSCTPRLGNIYETPTKKTKASAVEGNGEQTPSTRRKSILKSASSRLEGTPKRNIHLSNIVEKRVFQENEIISTPKRSRKTIAPINIDDNTKDDEYTPKKTPKRGRRSSTKQQKSPSHEATPLTPSQKLKLIRSGAINPSLEERQAVTKSARKSELQQAREQLHVSVVPKSLPCREKEFENIYTFLEGKIQDECGGCMYVSGVPGTGKTATVTGVIRELQKRVAKDDFPEFDFLEINGMRLTEPRQAYVQIYKQLTGKTVSWEHAHSLLEKRFTTPAPRRVTTVLLVDELDILCNRRQDVVYNLLDWPTKSAARLVVVTIANTMDLPERLLMGKVTSRLGLTRLTFQPYTHKQLQEIVTARLSGTDAFKSEAVQLVARKVAAVSGDARRALDICRRATEIADASSVPSDMAQKCVTMLHVQQALAEMIASAKVQAIKNCSRIEQLFLQAIVAEVTRTGVEETNFMGVYTQIESIAAFMGATVPTSSRALRICSKLGAERLIICEHSRNDVFQKILLNVSSDDIHYALRVSA